MDKQTGRLLGLPLHLINDILATLPIETVFRCKCVCKTFLNLITDPYFSEIHLNRDSDLDYSVIIKDSFSPFSLFLVTIVDFQRSSDCVSQYWQTLNLPARIRNSKNNGLGMLMGSCNGLICLQYNVKGYAIFYICNPILGEFMSLPDPKFDMFERAGFGFCSKTKKYKVIRFVKNLYCEIHTLGTNEWRKIDNAPLPYGVISFDSSINGNLHWISNKQMICSFNLNTGSISFITPPSQFDEDFPKRKDKIHIGKLRGLFCICCWFDQAIFDVFVMIDYGVKESWVKESSIDFSWLFFERKCLNTVRFLNNGDLMLTHINGSLIYYNHRKGTTIDITTKGFYDAIGYFPSFISIMNIAEREKVEVVQRNKR